MRKHFNVEYCCDIKHIVCVLWKILVAFPKLTLNVSLHCLQFTSDTNTCGIKMPSIFIIRSWPLGYCGSDIGLLQVSSRLFGV